MASAFGLYDYHLPPELIAQQPVARRADARLMVVDRQRASIDHYHVRDLPDILAAGDCLVFNNTRVIPAALVGFRTLTGGRWQGLFLSIAAGGHWRLLGKTRGRISIGETITLIDRGSQEDISLRLIEKQTGGVWLFQPETDENVLDVLERAGRVPIPHYIRGGQMKESDLSNYQTVFASEPGAVAAPTAGLHFTQELLRKLADSGVGTSWLTLHVGLGTFRPLTGEALDEHKMHSEWGEIGAEAVDTIRAAREAGGRVVSVGTTTTRVLETASGSGRLEPWQGDTDLFIRPPYRFRTVDALLTNFHLPRTTLLVLAYTFGGDALMRQAYEAAIADRYRFYSYGDAMLIM